MKLTGFGAGVAVGMAAAAAVLKTAYPSVGKKMMRDGRKLWKSVANMF